MVKILEAYLKDAANQLNDLEISELKKHKILITGGTGFIGSWILLLLNKIGIYNFTVLTRNAEKIKKVKCVKIIDDISNIDQIIEKVKPTIIFHLATITDAKYNLQNPYSSINTFTTAIFKIINSAAIYNTRIIFSSSGAVYGNKQSDQYDIHGIQENDVINIYDYNNSYADSKRFCESALFNAKKEFNLSFTSLRLFAFAGAGLPLDLHFAAGNFAKDCANGKYPTIESDGSAIRSWMHPVDCALWILKSGINKNMPLFLNCGSNIKMNIKETADTLSKIANLDHKLAQSDKTIKTNAHFYVPSIALAEKNGLKITHSSESALKNLYSWALIVKEKKITSIFDLI